jgi:hypothetical protein
MDERMLNQRRQPWSAPTTDAEASRRAGGRRAYNTKRRFMAAHRRRKVLELLCRTTGFGYGCQARIAAILGTSPATVSRDCRALRQAWLDAGGIIWPADLYVPGEKKAARMLEGQASRRTRTSRQ